MHDAVTKGNGDSFLYILMVCGIVIMNCTAIFYSAESTGSFKFVLYVIKTKIIYLIKTYLIAN